MKTLWFKRKRYGWGWTPDTWQGWAVVVSFIVFQFFNAYRLGEVSHTNTDPLRLYLIETFIAAGMLIAICYFTGETPRWQWGEKLKKK